MKSGEINSLFKNLSKVIKNPRSDLKYKNKFIALGGIRKQNINILKMLNIYGMAGISYLKKNRPKNLGRFL